MDLIFSKRKIKVLGIIVGLLFMANFASNHEVLKSVPTGFQREYESETSTEYTLKGEFDPVEKLLIIKENILYTNTSKATFKSIYLHLYPNAFKEEKTVPFEQSDMILAYPKGFESGYMKITNIRSGKEHLKFNEIGIGDSILKVELKEDLKPGEKVNLDIDYMLKIPPSCGRFGYGNDTINLGNWYPIMAVYDEKGWNLDPYFAIGDPFYSHVGNYRIEILVPKEYNMAYSGKIIKKEEINGKVRWTIEGKNIRDFALILSDKYKVKENKVDDIRIKSYSLEENYIGLALKSAEDGIKIFNSLYGKYPYEQITVAASDFFIGGMEYPNIVFIDKTLYSEERKQMLEYVVVHEVAHQWWYGLVGNNEVKEAWLDEALTEYSTLLYYEKKYGKKAKDAIYKDMMLRSYNEYKNSKKGNTEKVYRSVSEFKDSREYQTLVYFKGAIFIENLRKELGDDAFFKVMKVYFDKYKYKIAKTEDFLNVCEQISNKNLEKFFKKWIDYERK
ncbi:MAG: M1 family metallopeptidase [Anaeromicrobium sp.]|uniref:M1 family metallopeptidase n=1 Tax=Anaeromicrobium sp. TaxID=1929132 RepID=UPI0025EBA55C|nr:M1 family metallopeptidase [Anaeromicrobium sp.]MCT4594320.1 M1 family metallopeptidase [Anaeromicrobium sp.]